MTQVDEFEQAVARVVEAGGERAVTELARVIGAALPHRDLRRLMSLARQCQRAAEGSEHAEALGVLTALTTTYVSEVAATQKQIDLGLLGERKTLVSVLRCLGDEVDRPSEIARRVGVSRSTTTKALNDLRHLGLVEGTSASSGDRRARSYRLTPSGNDAVAELSSRSVSELSGCLAG